MGEFAEVRQGPAESVAEERGQAQAARLQQPEPLIPAGAAAEPTAQVAWEAQA